LTLEKEGERMERYQDITETCKTGVNSIEQLYEVVRSNPILHEAVKVICRKYIGKKFLEDVAIVHKNTLYTDSPIPYSSLDPQCMELIVVLNEQAEKKLPEQQVKKKKKSTKKKPQKKVTDSDYVKLGLVLITSNSETGYKGVNKVYRNGTGTVEVLYAAKYKKRHLGQFKRLGEAAKAYAEAHYGIERLPVGWTSHIDSTSEKIFFHNKELKKSTWEIPVNNNIITRN